MILCQINKHLFAGRFQNCTKFGEVIGNGTYDLGLHRSIPLEFQTVFSNARNADETMGTRVSIV